MILSSRRTILILLLALVLSACVSGDEVLTLSTGGTGGTYYPIGSAIAQLLSEELENITVNSISSNASIANSQMLNDGTIDLALVQNNVAYWAYSGIRNFKGEQVTELRGIASLYPEAIQIVTLKSSGYKTVEDLRGKSINIGLKGSGINADAMNVLQAYDIFLEDIKVNHLSFAEAQEQLLEGTIDAAFVTAGFPTSSITNINLSQDIWLIEISDEKLSAMIEKSPYYSKAVIPAGTYSSIQEDIVTATTMATLVTMSEMDEATIYEITKILWENNDVLSIAHVKGKEITFESALVGMGIPLHEGAKRYYDERVD